jgi:transposase
LLVQSSLSLDDLATRYRHAQDAAERSHGQIIWLFAQGKTTHEVAEVTCYSLSWIRTLVHRYNQAEPNGLGDLRQRNPGGLCLVSGEQQEDLQHALDDPPPDGGLWSGAKVAAWILERTGRQVPPQRGWEYFKRLQFSPSILRPRPRDAQRDCSKRAKKVGAGSLVCST